jgi:chromosome segregation ATPase
MSGITEKRVGNREETWGHASWGEVVESPLFPMAEEEKPNANSLKAPEVNLQSYAIRNVVAKVVEFAPPSDDCCGSEQQLALPTKNLSIQENKEVMLVLSGFATELQRQGKGIQELQADNIFLAGRVKALTLEVDGLKEDKKTFAALVRRLNSQVGEGQAKQEELEQQIEELRGTVVDREEALVHRNVQLEELQNELTIQKQANTNLNAQLTEATNNLQRITQQLDAMHRSEQEQLSTRHQQLGTRKDELHQSLTKKENALTKEEQELQHLNEQLANKKDQLYNNEILILAKRADGCLFFEKCVAMVVTAAGLVTVYGAMKGIEWYNNIDKPLADLVTETNRIKDVDIPGLERDMKSTEKTIGTLKEGIEEIKQKIARKEEKMGIKA